MTARGAALGLGRNVMAVGVPTIVLGSLVIWFVRGHIAQRLALEKV